MIVEILNMIEIPLALLARLRYSRRLKRDVCLCAGERVCEREREREREREKERKNVCVGVCVCVCVFTRACVW
jgi:hypothetical protein